MSESNLKFKVHPANGGTKVKVAIPINENKTRSKISGYAALIKYDIVGQYPDY